MEITPREMEWISVKDRLPDVNCCVAVRKTNHETDIMSYHQGFDVGNRDFWWWGFGKWNKANDKVTHWIQLPEPPKQLDNGKNG